MLSEWVYLLRVCVLKDFALLLVIVCVQLDSQGKGVVFCLHFSFFFLFSVRKFSGIAVKELLQKVEE